MAVRDLNRLIEVLRLEEHDRADFVVTGGRGEVPSVTRRDSKALSTKDMRVEVMAGRFLLSGPRANLLRQLALVGKGKASGLSPEDEHEVPLFRSPCVDGQRGDREG